jgi:hypothetical protein
MRIMMEHAVMSRVNALRTRAQLVCSKLQMPECVLQPPAQTVSVVEQLPHALVTVVALLRTSSRAVLKLWTARHLEIAMTQVQTTTFVANSRANALCTRAQLVCSKLQMLELVLQPPAQTASVVEQRPSALVTVALLRTSSRAVLELWTARLLEIAMTQEVQTTTIVANSRANVLRRNTRAKPVL